MQKSDLTLVKEVFPHYSRSSADFPDRFYYAFGETDSESVYARMLATLESALSAKQWLPVPRMSHGEFMLTLGHRLMPPNPRLTYSQRVIFRAKALARTMGIMPNISYGNSMDTKMGVSRERLLRRELAEARRIWIEGMRIVAQHGLIAANFQNRFDSDHIIDPFLRQLEKKGVIIRGEALAPFFGVYALLCGPDFKRLVEGKHLAVVTWLDEGRRAGLEQSCREAGVKELTFLPVSPHRAVLEELDLSGLKSAPDVAIFACGTGSVPMMLPFRHHGTLCLDGGYAVDVLANPEIRGNRAWTLPEELYSQHAAKSQAAGQRMKEEMRQLSKGSHH